MNNLEIMRLPAPRHFRVKACLRWLGLPYPCRWEHAEPRLKQRIIAARQVNDDNAAAEASGIKAFLKRNLRKTCELCLSPITSGKVGRICAMCRTTITIPKATKF